ncbi:MAG: T9SS type A sorting domain-containing protein [Cyclonatronaceae bacterium]
MKKLYQIAVITSLSIVLTGTAIGQNLLTGGNMESEDHWNVSHINSDVDTEYEFGYTVDTPKHGAGGNLMVTATVTGNPGNQLGNIVFYQEVTLTGGETYFFDAAFKDVEGVHQFWAEVSIRDQAPEVGEDWGQHFSGFNTWGGCGNGVDGTFLNDGCEGEGDNRITIEGEGELTLYFGIKVGLGSWGANEINSYKVLIDEVSLVQVSGTSVSHPENPVAFELGQNYPNPFNPSTTIRFSLPETSHVTLEVFTVNGQKVAEVLNETRSAGLQSVTFDAADLSSGLYIYRLVSGSFVQTRKMQLIK